MLDVFQEVGPERIVGLARLGQLLRPLIAVDVLEEKKCLPWQ
jgi:hypothetical protein